MPSIETFISVARLLPGTINHWNTLIKNKDYSKLWEESSKAISSNINEHELKAGVNLWKSKQMPKDEIKTSLKDI